MPDYPKWLQLEPLGDAWPGELTKFRQPDQFQSTLGKTSGRLSFELEKIGATNPRLRVAVERFQITVDGSRLKAGQQPWHPGVVLVFDTKQGEQVYPADQYLRWQANLHAIALTLEALRALDRWGVTHGQQYRGFLAIEPPRAASALPFTDYAGARDWLLKLPAVQSMPASSSARDIVRAAQRSTHPDLGGDPDLFRIVNAAADYLREAGAP